MKVRNISSVISPPPVHFVGDGFRVHNFIPGNMGMERMDPFIMMDYNSKFYFTPSERQRGVDVHPHRGFETVTIAYKGKVAHHDSTGNSGVIGEGDVQWMTAGSGILHKEYHEEEFSKRGGDFQMVQLWVNLPAKYKMTPPAYQAIENKDIPVVVSEDGKAEAGIIAGHLGETKGAAKTFSPMQLFNIRMQEGGTFTVSSPEDYSTGLLCLSGNVVVNDDKTLNENHFAVFAKTGTDITLRATADSVLLYLSGQPLREPIVAHGPFVMNTHQQISEAIADYRSGRFGHLE